MEHTSTMAEGSSRWLWFLSLSLVLLVVVVGVVVYGQLIGPAVPAPASGVADDQVTARQAFAPAAGLAGQWQEDARLAVVSGYRPAVGTQAGGQVEWAFQFFSASAQQLALITVADERARMVLRTQKLSGRTSRGWKITNVMMLLTKKEQRLM